MTAEFPQPVELDDQAMTDRALAQRLGRAIADQHPGLQVSESITDTAISFRIAHPAIDWQLDIAREDGDTATTLEIGVKQRAMCFYAHGWRDGLMSALNSVEVTNANGDTMSLEQGFTAVIELMKKVRGTPKKFMLVGNGGSAAIASHMAEDFTKNGKVRAVTFNDAALLTCFANDYGYWNVFLECVRQYGLPGDVLIAISSSGKSASITAAVAEAGAGGIVPITFSGFAPDNTLRAMGQINFYVPSHQYGFVETAHAALLHSILDIFNGWVGQV